MNKIISEVFKRMSLLSAEESKLILTKSAELSDNPQLGFRNEDGIVENEASLLLRSLKETGLYEKLRNLVKE